MPVRARRDQCQVNVIGDENIGHGFGIGFIDLVIVVQLQPQLDVPGQPRPDILGDEAHHARRIQPVRPPLRYHVPGDETPRSGMEGPSADAVQRLRRLHGLYSLFRLLSAENNSSIIHAYRLPS